MAFLSAVSYRLQEAKLVALGCKPTKKPKEPYRITLARNKATAERERKKKAFEEKHGLHVTQPSTRKALVRRQLLKGIVTLTLTCRRKPS